ILTLLGLPGPAAAMTYEEARHLLARTGFGGGARQIQTMTRLDYPAAVARILSATNTVASTPPPEWVDAPPPDFRELRSMNDVQRKQFRRQQREQAMELKGWWYAEMLATPSPLTERMTLFWHNHFTSSVRKVKWPTLMYRQNALLRRHALGNFRALLHAVAEDPAMVIYLDNQTNRKGKPNENFARELLELFTLGEGHYTERDIKEAARAFTGWRVDRRSGQFRFRARQHDTGMKEFFGYRGAFNGEDILDIILEQPQVAVHITEKLWREFISETPDGEEVRRLAAIFRDNDYEIKPLLQALLLSPHFRTTATRGTLVKSPVELVVGTVRLFQIPIRDSRRLARLGRHLGQDVFTPPNVKGWPGGTAWITTSTLLARQQLLERVMRGPQMREGDRMRRDIVPVVMSARQPPWLTRGALAALDSQELERLLLPLAPAKSIPDDIDMPTRAVALILDPVYQLK
ncbi:MAG: DUF1800 family protein, partial [Acidiferrobacterales bacterium]